jgi:CRISPR-associated exonuclease Cas4
MVDFWLVGAGVAAAVLAVVLLAWAARLRGRTGLPSGRVVASDTGAIAGRRGKRLRSERYGLSGAPDYLIETGEGIIPVELKPARNDAEPRESHLMQLLAYCLLVEENYGARPTHGVLRYANQSFRVDYNDETRAYLLDVLDRMRGDAGGTPPGRSHDQPGRCRACAYRLDCEVSLWPER